ncbi:MAG TPA: Ig-like domain-containing protein, partial [Vicinamibacterales bacterium]|nr:Ig-like domain-containing protein [Vicinamibacterales bacterium]
MRIRYGVVWLALLAAVGPVRAQTTLSVVSAQPVGEVASLPEAAEIRVRFSEPMIPIGALPDEVTAPFFSIAPAVSGTFRWAGPTLLIFTPDAARPLPNATRYDVTVAAGVKALSGRTLARPYTFSFTTPTVRLLRTEWYRINGRFDQPAILALHFNQAVRPADVLAHVTARYARHDWAAPSISAEERSRMGASAAAAFDAKVATVAATAASTAPVPLRLAPDWDKKRFPPAADLVVLQTESAPSPDGWLLVEVDNRLPAIAGRATPPRPQSHTTYLEPTLFVDQFWCRTQCDADAYNSSRVRARTGLDALRRAATVRDITDRAAPAAVTRAATPPARARNGQEAVFGFSFEDIGYDRQPPARTYAVTIDAGLQALDGQTLGYAWTGIVENWHARAFTSFGDGHGVWEAGGGPLPFYGRNFTDVWQWATAIAPNRLMPTIQDLTAKGFHAAPSGDGVHPTLGGANDKILSHGLDLSGALKPSGTGLLWAAIRQGQPIARARTFPGGSDTIASIVQVTNLGITVKDSPQNTLVFVTRLDTGVPVPGADVSIVRLDNQVAWSGRTDPQGVALAPQMALRNQRNWNKFAFIVTASKDGDLAYVSSDWNEGVEPYAFGMAYDISEAQPLLRGTVFTDRGVYKLSEDIHVKAILRRDTPSGIQLIKKDTPIYVAVHDSRGKVVDRRTVTINAWSTTEWVMHLPGDGALGDYEIVTALEKNVLEDKTPRPPEEEDAEDDWQKSVRGSFLVAAYRRPEFRV